MLRALNLNPTESDIDDLLNMFDMDGSGSLNFSEVVSHWMEVAV